MPDCVSNSESISKLHSCEPVGDEQHCCCDLHKRSARSLACSFIHYVNIIAQIMADWQRFLTRVIRRRKSKHVRGHRECHQSAACLDWIPAWLRLSLLKSFSWTLIKLCVPVMKESRPFQHNALFVWHSVRGNRLSKRWIDLWKGQSHTNNP